MVGGLGIVDCSYVVSVRKSRVLESQGVEQEAAVGWSNRRLSMTNVRFLLCGTCLIRFELGFLGELDDAFLVPLPGILFAHGPSVPSALPRGSLVIVIRVVNSPLF